MAKKTSLTSPYFHDDDKAREYLESVRWANGPVCPHCGAEGGSPIKGKETVRKDGRVQKARQGLYKCTQKACRQQFSVTVGTVFERSHIPLSKWLMAAYLLCSSKKGMSAPISCTAPLMSPTRLHGSWPIASAMPWHLLRAF